MADCFLGEIKMFGGNYAPEGWLLCNGQELAISAYTPLFSLIGTTYGGNGTTTFKLPDLRCRVPLHYGQNLQTGTSYALAQAGGAETVTLTESQLPTHTHTANCQTANGTQAGPAEAVWASPRGVNQYLSPSSPPLLSLDPTSIGATGGVPNPQGGDNITAPHDNVMPFLVISFIISTNGIFPPRP